MKNYISTMEEILNLQHPDAECSCYREFVMDESVLCDLCLSRLKQQRRKINRRFRMKSKVNHKFKD